MMMLRCCSFALALTSHDLRTTLPAHRIAATTLALHMSSSAENNNAGDISSSSSAAAASNDATATTPTSYAQHIVLRGDLLDTWGTGPMITQGAHVSVAAIETYRHMAQTQSYLQELDNMRKVTWKAKNEAWLEKIAEWLDDANVEYKIWIEQPENIKVGLATRPVLREETETVWKGNGIKMWR